MSPPQRHPVDVWLIPLDPPTETLEECAVLLDTDERRRVLSMLDPRNRRRFTAAHGAIRVILSRYLGVPAGLIRWRRGEHGKPELAGGGHGLRVNLSHSGDLAALAVSRRRAVGVDVQRLAPVDATALAARYFPETEAKFVASGTTAATRLLRFTRLWTRKEACVKASGARLAEGLGLPVDGRGRGAGRGMIAVRGTEGTLPGPYLVCDLDVPNGYRASVALAGTAPFEVVRRDWPDVGADATPAPTGARWPSGGRVPAAWGVRTTAC
ncbi:4'-phosphopantetheinyl transferase family protein [Luedemannella helvata]|uniref:4'-phosphopantetheinyl transferase family protein n=1 Tax=Luedemannella helvata TaxID=349315 RepID=UPI0031DF7E21